MFLPVEIQAARTKVCQQMPYFATALMSLTFLPREGLGTMATDKRWRTYYDPQWVATLPMGQLCGLLIHELMHLLRQHMVRGGEGTCYPEWQRFNIAGDLEINDDADLFGEWGGDTSTPSKKGLFTLPPKGQHPTLHNLPSGLLAEEYYTLLPPSVQIQVTGAKTGCGSCSHGGQEDYEESSDSKDAPGIGDVEGRLIQRITATEVERATEKSRGTVPASLQRWAKELLNPVVPWQEVLRGTLRASVAGAGSPRDWTYRRPSRRQLPGVVLPAVERHSPSVAMGIDTSGSMSANELRHAVTEVQSLLSTMGLRSVPVITGDAEVGSEQIVSNAHQITLTGGGGTDMRIILEALEKRGCDVAVLYTDGETPWPEHALTCDTIILCSTDAPTPEWAKTIRIPRDAFKKE